MLSGMILGGALGAIGGLVGFGLASIFAKVSGSEEISRWPSVIGVALALTLSHPLNEWINRPTAEGILEDLEKNEPFYIELRKNYPEVYSEISKTISESIERGNLTSAKDGIRSIVFPIISREIPNASDDTLFVFALLVRDQALALADEHPEQCVALLKGEARDIQLILPAGLITRENGLYRRLFAEHNKSGKVASEAQVEFYLRKLIPNIQRDLNVSADQVIAALNFEGPADLQCRASAAFFDGFTEAWSQDRGPEVLRAILKRD